MADETPEPQRITAQLAWIGIEDVPVVFVNQMLGQIDDKGEVLITFGQATPPVIVGPAEEAFQAGTVPFVQVRPVARITMSRARLEEVVDVLQKTLDNQARVLKQLSEGGPKEQ
jgi:hypothetical protein